MRTHQFSRLAALLALVVVSGCADAPVVVPNKQVESIAQAAALSKGDIQVQLFGHRASSATKAASTISASESPTPAQLRALRRDVEDKREQLGHRQYARALRALETLASDRPRVSDLRNTLIDRATIRNNQTSALGGSRWDFSGSRGRLVSVSDTRGGSVLSSVVMECTEFQPAEECGYDPNYNPEPLIADIAAMQAEVSAQEAAAYAAEAAVNAGGGDPCRVERLKYIQALMSFVGSATYTVYYAWRKDPVKASAGALATYYTLWSVAIANAAWLECLDRVREENKRDKPR